MQDVLDYRAQHLLRSWIRNDLSIPQQAQLKSVLNCGTQAVRYKGAATGVYVVTNRNTSKFFGQSHCQNPWCCPVCSARRMEFYRAKVATAIDLLRDEGFFGFMVTFTIPHLRFMTCRETTDILYKTWTYFRMKGAALSRKKWHVYQTFSNEIGIEHFVRVCEYTWGKDNGWHPHFHAIFWCKRENADKILEWQDRLNEFWTKTAKRVTLTYWKEKNLHQNEDLNELCERLFKGTEIHQEAVKISVDKKTGKIMEALSSNYICGWGGDRELTGNVHKQASHNGHYTPYQILEMAERNEDMKKLYLEFCLSVTTKPVHHRVDFSQTGISPLAEEHMEKFGYTSEHYEKKTTWEVVEFITSEEWSDICYFDRFAPVLSNILYLATTHREILTEYIDSVLGYKRRRSVDAMEMIERQCRAIERMLNGTQNRSASSETSTIGIPA